MSFDVLLLLSCLLCIDTAKFLLDDITLSIRDEKAAIMKTEQQSTIENLHFQGLFGNEK